MKLSLSQNGPISLENKRLLVRMPNWLGDAVMATACLEDLLSKAKDYSAHTTVLAQDSVAELLANTPHIADIISFSRKKELKTQEAKRVTSLIKKASFDIGLLFTGSFSSALQLYSAGIPVRVGFSTHFRSPLLTHAQNLGKESETTHLVETYKQLLLPFGIEKTDTPPKLYLSEEEKQQADRRLQLLGATKSSTLIGINPGAAYGSAKCWPEDHFISLTRELLSFDHVQIIYFGDSASKPLVDEITKHFPERVHNLAAKTSLRELLALISSCELFITNDSGPMHAAAALGTPLVALFGSTNSIKTGPYPSPENKHGVVIQNKIPCSPCYLRKCPIDFRCMKSLSAAAVFDVVKKYVS